MELKDIMGAVEGIESKLNDFAEKASGEIKEAGTQSVETKNAIEKLGEEQREFAGRLLEIEQRGEAHDMGDKIESVGDQFIKSDNYAAFVSGSAQKARFEAKSTLTGGDATVGPDRAAGIVGGAFQPLTLESFLPSVPTSSNAIEFTKEASFTNNAAETAEGGAKPETDITFSLVNMPVSTVAHWIKISKQLAADNAALAAYVNSRMIYGVNLKVEQQLVSGDGVAPNISGILDSGNFTAHGYLSGDLGTNLKKYQLIRKMIADAWNSGYPADAIILNPADFAQMELDALDSTGNNARVAVDSAGQLRVWGLPVIQSVGMTADQVAVGAFGMACTVHNREGVVVELSDSDSDNFTKNLVTVRAERRLALAVERPAAIRAGDITPPAV